MIEIQKIISVSKPHRSFTERKVSFEKVAGKLVKKVELLKVRKTVFCILCEKQIPAGAPHKTAEVIVKDDEKLVTRHLPFHPDCPFKF